jgi:uncharacterized LabA/DUF88 family protein
MLMSDEIVDALMTIEAVLVATSPSASTPTALRNFCDEFSERLHRKTRSFQENPELRSAFEIHTVGATN